MLELFQQNINKLCKKKQRGIIYQTIYHAEFVQFIDHNSKKLKKKHTNIHPPTSTNDSKLPAKLKDDYNIMP